MDYQRILDEILAEVQPCLPSGKIAGCIPELASVPPTRFGMALQTLGGATFGAGSWQERFSVRSISNGFTLATQLVGDRLWARIGCGPPGNPLNSLVAVQHENGKLRSPSINGGH